MALGMAFIMSFFIFSQCGRGAQASEMNDQKNHSGSDTPVATVGSFSVTSKQITDETQQVLAQQNRNPDVPPPPASYAEQAQAESQAINRPVQNAGYQYIADRDHIVITDPMLVKTITDSLNTAIDQQKAQLGLKPNASQAEIDAAFKKKFKKSASDILKDNLAQVDKVMAVPEMRAKLVASALPEIVQAAEGNAISATPADVRSNYDTYVVKRLTVASKPLTDTKAIAAKALADIKGGLSFEAAINKYSTDPATKKGGKPSDNTMNIPKQFISMQPSFKVLDGQKAGFVSPVQDDPSGQTIYKITSITNTAPKDIDTNFAKYKKQYVDGKVATKLQADVKAVLESKLKWSSPAYQALYDYGKTFEVYDPAARSVALQKVVTEAKDAMKSGTDKPAALAAWFVADTALAQSGAPTTPGTPPKDNTPADRVELLTAVLEDNEDYGLRMELVDLQAKKKDGPGAIQNLVQASQANSSYDMAGQSRFQDIAAKGASLVKEKLISQADLKPLDDAQAQWRTNKADADKMDAETKAQMDQEKKQSSTPTASSADNDKANADAVKKQKEEAAKPGAGKADNDNDKANEEAVKKQKEEAAKATKPAKP